MNSQAKSDGVKRLYAHKPRKGMPRPAETYRAARRNAARGSVWKGVVSHGTLFVPPVRPNRSRKWKWKP